ncbi:MAG: type IV pilus twitching motility protein PilT [Myxococcota bacterium]|nr:type IV pilus twitching motility protein PilT [Myxococcota bacterium]
MKIADLLRAMLEVGASDLHLTAGVQPCMRVHGELRRVSGNPLTGDDTRSLAYAIMTDSQKHKFEEHNELDFSFGLKGLARFRGNVFVQRGNVAAVFRVIPYEILSFEALGLPAVVAEMARRPRGLILVTGPTGSGKSTTLASMIDRINRERREHIVTIEDPIEFVHDHKNCIINQREVGADTKSFGRALKSALRQDPDVILLGELRDLETIEIALKMAETGHLALATLHTNSCVQTITRIVDAFDASQQAQIRLQLSFVLEGVLCQQLLPTKNGKGRALAMEIMNPTPAVRNIIREDKLHQLYGQMQINQGETGTLTLTQSLVQLVLTNKVTANEARTRAADVKEFDKALSEASGQTGSGTQRMRGR